MTHEEFTREILTKSRSDTPLQDAALAIRLFAETISNTMEMLDLSHDEASAWVMKDWGIE